MKKNYIKPNTATITVKVQNLLQDSINMGGSQGTFTSGMTQASRDGGADWDDDEE